MASVEIEYECNACKQWDVTGIRHPKVCGYCGHDDLYVIVNNLEVPCGDTEDSEEEEE